MMLDRVREIMNEACWDVFLFSEELRRGFTPECLTKVHNIRNIFCVLASEVMDLFGLYLYVYLFIYIYK